MGNQFTIEEEIAYRKLTGDYYPLMAAWLRSSSRTPVSGASTNVCGCIGKTEEKWIGLRLHMMFPDEASAKRFLPGLFALMDDVGLASSQLLKEQLTEALDPKTPEFPVRTLWFDDCGLLTRSKRGATKG